MLAGCLLRISHKLGRNSAGALFTYVIYMAFPALVLTAGFANT